MYFIYKILCFEEFLNKIALFFKKLVFLEFRSIKPVSQPIEIAIKILIWLCVFRLVLDCYWINRMYFRSIENRIESFFKTFVFHYSNLFENTFSLYSIGLRVKARFLSFLTKFLQGFLSSKAGKTFIPLLFSFIFMFHAFFHAF